MLGHRTRRIAALLTLALAPLVALSGAPTAAHAEPTSDPDSGTYAAMGAPVDGGESIAQAPLIAPGIHLDEFATGGTATSEEGTVKLYRVQVGAGEILHASATIVPPPYTTPVPSSTQEIEPVVDILGASGDTCRDGSSTTTGDYLAGDGPVTSSAVSTAAGEGCPAGAMFVRVARTGARASGTALPMEIQVSVERAGAVTGSPSTSEGITDDTADPVAPESSEPVDPGRSLGDPLTVAPGSYLVRLAPGDVASFGIDVQAGQRLRWRTEVVSDPGENPGRIWLNAWNPAREMTTVAGGDFAFDERGTINGGSMGAPVVPGNRSSDDTAVASAWLPGRYTVSLRRGARTQTDVEWGGSSGDQPVTLILTLQVEGKADPAVTTADLIELGDVDAAHAGAGPVERMLGISGTRVLALGGAAVLGLTAVATGVGGLVLLRRR